MKNRIYGTTKECFWHYLSELSEKGKESEDSRKFFIDFLGSSQRTISDWLAHKYLPHGFVLIKLRYLLEKEGYQIHELGKLSPSIRDLGWLIAFGHLDANQVYQAIGVDSCNRLYSVLHGQRGISKERMLKVEQIVATHRELIELTKTSNALQNQSVQIEKIEEKKENIKSVPNWPIEQEMTSLLKALESNIFLLLPRLEYILSPIVPVAQRQKIRDFAGRQLLFDLSNKLDYCVTLLNAACSEKTRELFQQSQNKK
ncbi:MAG TPA: hypothetical protein P5089_01255 [Candidatus Portnoybacteria bacterium]|nr:hypothetical protein [Candidatus Portnoybacteria bacterium]